MQKLTDEFYSQDTQIVAKYLLGKYLVHIVDGVQRVGRIVETEAYLGAHDLAAHSSRRVTNRTKIMYGPAGFAYVYLIYGMYYCMNVVTETEGSGSAVLIRALEPVENIDGKTQGPGLLCKAMKIDKNLNGHSLISDNFFIAAPELSDKITIIRKPRIGVDYAKHWAKRLLRFYIKDNIFVSKI